MEGQMNSNSRWVGITAVAAVVACVGACAAIGLALKYAPDLYMLAERQNTLKVGAAAPDFSLVSLGGKKFQLSQFRGQPVVLTFAASWCPDCRAEAPLLQDLHESHPKLVILLVDSSEEAAVVQGFARDFGMTHPVLLDRDGAISIQYRIYAIPTQFFIDSAGIIRGALIEGITPKLLAENLPLIGVEP
jgi:peroxiredoxin